MKIRKSGILLFTIGILALSSAVVLWIYNAQEEHAVIEYSDQKAHDFLTHIAEAVEENISDISDTEDMKYIVLDDGESYIGILGIPALNLVLPVNGTWSYPALKKTPCRYSGNTQDDSIVIAAHNYASHFKDIAGLANGELVTFTEADGNEIKYQVSKTLTVQPSDVVSVVNSEYDLTLFTCTNNGKARVVVRCTRITDTVVEALRVTPP